MNVLTAPEHAGPARAGGSPAPAGRPAPVEPRWFLASLARIRIAAGAGSGALGIVELTGPQGDMPPLHVHHREDETFLVLEGELSLFLPGAAVRLGPGEAFLAPRGIAHAYRVESATARYLAISTPGGFASFVEGVSVPADADGLPPAGLPVDMPALLAAAEAHGIEILGPPGLLP